MTTSATGQSIKIIPRLFNAVNNIVVRDTSENESYTYNNINTSFSNNNYLTFTNQGTGYVDASGDSILKEGRFYDLKVNDANGVIYKDEIFVTTQTINQANNNYYDINKDEYTFDETAGSHDNDYIIV